MFTLFLNTLLATAFGLQISNTELGKISVSNLLTGQPVTIEASPKDVTVVAFLSSDCPCSKDHESILKNMAQTFPSVRFIGVHSNSDESTADAKEHFAAAQMPFPILQDSQTALANFFRANKTPHVFVITPDGHVVFQGGITDSRRVASASKNYLSEALVSLRQNKPIAVSEAKTLGCAIAR